MARWKTCIQHKERDETYHSEPASRGCAFELLPAAAEANVEGAIVVVVGGCEMIGVGARTDLEEFILGRSSRYWALKCDDCGGSGW
jgi:hypothetical protein